MSTVLYLYCVTPELHAPTPGLKGLEDSAVFAVPAHGLAVWASQLENTPAASIPRIQRHNEVIEAALTEDITPVPLRFGQSARNENALFEAIQVRAATWHELLSAFAGSVEFGLQIVDPTLDGVAREVHSEDRSSGRGYLAALAQRQRVPEGADAVLQVVRDEASSLVRSERLDPLKTKHGVATIAHLVPRDRANDYQARMRAVAERLPEYRFLRSGPWPPYSFAS